MFILVTGGCGYIGSHTVIELLTNGYEVVVVDNLVNSSRSIIDKIQTITSRKFIFFEGDVADNNLINTIFENYDIRAVLHFAGHKAVYDSICDPLSYYTNNLGMTFNLIKIMKKYNVRNIIFSSSATVYGSTKSPVKESDLTGICITNPYGKTKFMLEEIFKDLWSSDKSWTIFLLRYFNPVGAHSSGLIGENPRDTPNNLMPIIMRSAASKNALAVFGNDYDTVDGSCIRDFIHVVDLARGHIACLSLLNSNQLHIFNLGTGCGTTVKNLIQTFSFVNNIDVKYNVVDRRPGDVAISFADVSKADTILNWRAEYDIKTMCVDSWRSFSP
ncbi:MAG: UDP-glucose 4-epimerase GalE [Rickettsiales bacterium]|nr:MAG: UDP-glucose 4-epimerase GalE [Rickettsiales bacterium]